MEAQDTEGIYGLRCLLIHFLKRKEPRHIKLAGERGSADEVVAKDYPVIVVMILARFMKQVKPPFIIRP